MGGSAELTTGCCKVVSRGRRFESSHTYSFVHHGGNGDEEKHPTPYGVGCSPLQGNQVAIDLIISVSTRMTNFERSGKSVAPKLWASPSLMLLEVETSPVARLVRSIISM